MEVPPSWMAYFMENPTIKWMIWGYPHFRKPRELDQITASFFMLFLLKLKTSASDTVPMVRGTLCSKVLGPAQSACEFEWLANIYASDCRDWKHYFHSHTSHIRDVQKVNKRAVMSSSFRTFTL